MSILANTIATECTTPFSNRFVHTHFHAATYPPARLRIQILCHVFACIDSPIHHPPTHISIAYIHSTYPYRVQPRLCSLQKQTPTYMQKMTQQWQAREIDNYTYLMHLNRVAGSPSVCLRQSECFPKPWPHI